MNKLMALSGYVDLRSFVDMENDVELNNTAKPQTDTNARVARGLGRSLTPEEKMEAATCGDTVYYLPLTHGTHSGIANHGYDDKNGRYMTTIGDHFFFRYQVKSKLGMGAFGDCYKVLDHKTQKEVALKVIRNEPRFKRQGLIEIEILEKVRDDALDNHTVVIVDHFEFRNHLCLTFDLHGQDLYSELSSRGFVGFSTVEAAVATKNILESLSLLHRHRIVHGDLKPENVLISGEAAKGEVTVIDLGSSCFENEKIQTYIQSRYYRAPEIVLGAKSGCPIDMWSVGCVLYELVGGRPIFHAKNERDLLLYHMELMGPVPNNVLSTAKRTGEFFIRNGNDYFLKNVTDRRGRTRIPGTRVLADTATMQAVNDPTMVHFIQRCLELDPAKRMTPKEALAHPFIAQHTLQNAQLLRMRETGSSDSIDSGLDSEMGSPHKKSELMG